MINRFAFYVALAAALPSIFIKPVKAADFPFLLQNVTLDTSVTPNKFIATGDGPFKEMFPDGVAITDPKLLGGNKFNAAMFGPRETPFGSDGYEKGVVFRNDAKRGGVDFKVHDIEVTLTSKTDTFTGSKNGDDYEVTIGTNADGFPTLSVVAKPGKDLNPGQYLWMKIPAAPPNDGTSDTAKFTGKLTPDLPPPPAPAPATPRLPATGNSGGGLTPSPGLNFNFDNGALNFTPGSIDFAQYLDGSVATANSSLESIIGSEIDLLATQLVGPISGIPGAQHFTDTFLSISQGSTAYLGGTLTDVNLFPDTSVAGFDSVLQAVLVWEQTSAGEGSRYLAEKFSQRNPDGLFFRTNLLSATSGLTTSGSSTGDLSVRGITSVPEPAFVAIFGVGVLQLLVWRRRSTRQRLAS